MKTKLNKTEAVDKNGKIWDKESIQKLIDTNNQAVINGLLRIYANQTTDEQSIQMTKYYNSVGFTGADAEILSSFVEFYNKFGKLSDKQMSIARKKMKKYWKQLLEVIKQENVQTLRLPIE